MNLESCDFSHESVQSKTQTHEVDYYNLDMIISVGYIVKPHYNNYGVYIIGLYDFLLNENIINF